MQVASNSYLLLTIHLYSSSWRKHLRKYVFTFSYIQFKFGQGSFVIKRHFWIRKKTPILTFRNPFAYTADLICVPVIRMTAVAHAHLCSASSEKIMRLVKHMTHFSSRCLFICSTARNFNWMPLFVLIQGKMLVIQKVECILLCLVLQQSSNTGAWSKIILELTQRTIKICGIFLCMLDTDGGIYPNLWAAIQRHLAGFW